jgi:CubicO group peptidase (beta-lactamase class C family)
MLSSDRFEWTHAVLEQGLAERLIPGAVVSAFEIRRGGEEFILAAGSRRVLPSVQPMAAGTVFDWASLTKALCTAPLIWRALQRGWLSESTEVRAVLPQSPEAWKGITIGHLLSHSAGFKAWDPVWQELVEKWGPRLAEVAIEERQQLFRSRIFKQLPEAAPGERFLYSDFSFLLLGFILEEIHGQPLDRIWRREMPGISAGFRRVQRPGSLRQPVDEACAATEVVEWRGGALQGEVHDENCWSMGGFAGHAGLFGSMGDLIAVVRRIFDPSFLDPLLGQRMLARVLGPQGPARTLGWDLPDGPESSAGPTLASRRGVVGHLGFTGTSLWIDLESGWGFSMLSGRVHLGRDHPGARKLRPRIHDAMAIDLRLDARSSPGPR